MAIDGAAHLLYRWHIIPAAVLGWVCDRFDLWLGVTPDELNRTRPT